MTRGFGIPATEDEDLVRRLAPLVEEHGYTTLWCNDTPAADGLRCLAWAADSTEDVRLGVGVVACDRRTPDEVASVVERLGLPLDRVVIGLGAGFSRAPLTQVSGGVERLRKLLPGATVAVAAMGPRMCALAGEIADVVLLNWMTPPRIEWARALAEAAGRRPQIASYVRVAVGEGAAARLAEEAGRYASMPHYARHFAAQGAQSSDVGVAAQDDAGAQEGLIAYDRALDECIVRALPASFEIGPLGDLARATAPRRYL